MLQSPTILSEIFAAKRLEVDRARQKRPLEIVQDEARRAAPPLDFVQALRAAKKQDAPALIAEIKYASPSRGAFQVARDPLRLARLYREGGAAAISVLTDQAYFQGRLDDLVAVARVAPRLPLLRKDFIFDPYQVFEARAAGADAILLIVAGLSQSDLLFLHSLALELGMTPLVEVHNPHEVDAALECKPRLVGINNRNLHTFQVDLDTTLQLRPLIPEEVCLAAESGIRSRQDVLRLVQAGVDGMLIGEALVMALKIPAKIRELLGEESNAEAPG